MSEDQSKTACHQVVPFLNFWTSRSIELKPGVIIWEGQPDGSVERVEVIEGPIQSDDSTAFNYIS